MTREILWKLGGWALDYPDEAWRRTLAEALAAVHNESPDSERLRGAVKELVDADPEVLRPHYVELFDFSPRRSLSLTYHEYADRRERGSALSDLVRRIRAAGLETTDGRLVDEIPVLLEYCAETGDAEVAGRVGAVLRRIAPHVPSTSPYRRLIEALGACLPAGVDVRPPSTTPEDPDDVPFPLRDPDVEEAVP